MGFTVTSETVADHLERLVGSPLVLREQIEGYVRASLGEAEITARSSAALLRRVRDKELYRPSGWRSWRSFCAFFSPEEPERIDILIRALEVLESRGEKRDFGMPEARQLAGWGGDRKSELARKDQERNPALEKHRGETRHRTLARLRRDDPALAARVERGELTANAAAVAKGWRKKRDPGRQLDKAWDAATPEQRAACVAKKTAAVHEPDGLEQLCQAWRHTWDAWHQVSEDERAAFRADHADKLRRPLDGPRP
jgi:hypothetical protein